ncbi:hypothetical protein TNCT6_76350 [Streptomyces sp. 6-11-2]|nr:hypothetical protein TNCT6_76350 [Streptomyces sp. 6-11-2]
MASSDSGTDLDVVLMGGGATIGAALGAGLVDVLTLHLMPVLLGAGTTVPRRSAAHTGAAKCDLDIDRDAPDLLRSLTTSLPTCTSRSQLRPGGAPFVVCFSSHS